MSEKEPVIVDNEHDLMAIDQGAVPYIEWVEKVANKQIPSIGVAPSVRFEDQQLTGSVLKRVRTALNIRRALRSSNPDRQGHGAWSKAFTAMGCAFSPLCYPFTANTEKNSSK